MLKNKCSVWKRIKFPTFWYNCYYFTWSDTYFIQLETLLINHPSYFSFVKPGQRNWYSDCDLGRISEGSWFYSRQGLETAALSRAVRPALEPSQPIPQVRRGQSLQWNQPQYEAACHTSISADVTNALNCSYLQLYPFMVWCFHKHRGSLMTVVDLYG